MIIIMPQRKQKSKSNLKKNDFFRFEPGNHGGAGEWLKEADDALKVPESLVKSLTEFNRDPAELYRYRERLADLIERAPGEERKP